MNKILTRLEIAGLVLALGAVLAIAISEVHSFDVFWQLQSGRYMAETGQVIRTDLFTLAPDAARYEHCWLHDMVLYGLYHLGGYAAISMWKGAMVAATVCLLIITARIRKSSLISILLLLPLITRTSGGWLERPQLWSFLLFSAFLLVLEHHRANGGKSIYALIPLMILWANLHAGSVLGVPVVGAYLAGNLASHLLTNKGIRFPQWKTFCATTALVILGGLCTPYATEFLKTLINAPSLGGKLNIGESSTPITELFNMDWTPTTFAAEPFFFFAIGVSALLLIISWRKTAPADIFLMAGMALMGFSLVRHIPFFYFACVAILPKHLDNIHDLVAQRLSSSWKNLARLALLVMATLCFWYFYSPLYKTYGLFSTGLRTWHYPIEATRFIEQHQLKQNLYNTYDWGGYIAWQLYPDYRVFWDGRQNSKDMFSLGWQVMAGHSSWEQILDRFKVNTIVSRASTIDTGQKYPLLDRLRAHPDWHLVFNSESSMVFVRSGTISDAWLKRYEKPKEAMDNTILSEAHLMVQYNPNRYMAWWEMAQIYLKRKQYQNAHFALQQHLMRSPNPVPQARSYYTQLTKKLGR